MKRTFINEQYAKIDTNWLIDEIYVFLFFDNSNFKYVHSPLREEIKLLNVKRKNYFSGTNGEDL